MDGCPASEGAQLQAHRPAAVHLRAVTTPISHRRCFMRVQPARGGAMITAKGSRGSARAQLTVPAATPKLPECGQ